MTVRITRKNKPEETKKALDKLAMSARRKKKKLSDFYGKMPNIYGDALVYQKRQRDEWA